MTNPLSYVATAAINDRRNAAARIAEDLHAKTGGVGYGYGYRPTLWDLNNERRVRHGLPALTTAEALRDGALLPPGGVAELAEMRKRYTKRARRNNKGGHK